MEDAAGYVDIMVRAPIETIQVLFQQALATGGFRVKLVNAYRGTVEKPIAKEKTAAGEPAKSCTFDFEIIRFESNAVVRLHRANPAPGCGAPDEAAASKELSQVISTLANWFNQHGCLQGILGL